LGSRGNGLGRSTVGEAGGEKSVLAVSGGTPTPTQQAIVTITVAPSATSTLTPTMTPTPEPRHLINYIGEDALWQYDLFLEESNLIMDIVPHDVEHSYYSNYLEWDSFLWSEDGRFLVYAPRYSSRFGSDDVFKGLYMYDVSQRIELQISDKISDYEVKSFSQNSEYFFLYSEMDGTPGLYLYDVSDQILTNIMYLTEKLNIYDISWEEESSILSFCLSSRDCKNYYIDEGLLEKTERPSTYIDKYNSTLEYLSDPEKEYGIGIWLSESTVGYLWEDQNEEGVYFLDLDDKSGQYYSGPEYEGIMNCWVAFKNEDYVVLEPYFGNCYFLLETDGLKFVEKYCVSHDEYGPLMPGAVQISSDNKLLFIFNQNQIVTIDLDNLGVSTVIMENEFIAPKVYKN